MCVRKFLAFQPDLPTVEVFIKRLMNTVTFMVEYSIAGALPTHVP